MNTLFKTICGIMLVYASFTKHAEAANAPTSLPPCIIQYTYSAPYVYTKRIVLYDASGVYNEIEDRNISPSDGRISTAAPHHGSFSYTLDAKNPGHASIIYDGGGPGTLPSDELYFSSTTSGAESPPAIVGGGVVLFTMYPMQSSIGAINLSNRGMLTAGNSTITGFVLGGIRTTWVFIRAVGSELASFGVPSTVSGPSFLLYDSKSNVVGTSLAWGEDPNIVLGYKVIASRIGAFPLSDNSDGGVLLLPLQPGLYTAVFTSKGAGQILCEMYIVPFSSDNQ